MIRPMYMGKRNDQKTLRGVSFSRQCAFESTKQGKKMPRILPGKLVLTIFIFGFRSLWRAKQPILP